MKKSESFNLKTAIGLGYRSKNKRNERSEVQSTKGKAFDEVNRETDGWLKCKAPKAKPLTK